MASSAVAADAPAAPTHPVAFRLRRFANWFPLGLTYAFLYMGRYNLAIAKNALVMMTNEDYGWIGSAGTVTYGLAFLFNGPLSDRIGGKRTMVISAFGAGAVNLVMGYYVSTLAAGTADLGNLRLIFALLYMANMYFQSFGAVAIVKVNSAWFHVRERGSFSGIFGIMISSGIFMAYTLNPWLMNFARGLDGGTTDLPYAKWIFFIPGALLLAMGVVETILLRDRPSEAGHADFDTGDAKTVDDGEKLPAHKLIWRIVTHPIILVVALIEFCTGVLRQGVMQWYPIFAKSVLVLPSSHPLRDGSWSNWGLVLGLFGFAAVMFACAYFIKPARRWFTLAGMLAFLGPFVQGGFGGILFVAGVIGGVVAGTVSDVFFGSRRAPAAGGLYLLLAVCTVAMFFALPKTEPIVGEVQLVKAKDGQMLPAVPELQPGDRIVSVNGKGDLASWIDVTRAIAAVPAKCEGSNWDSKANTCSTSAPPTPDLAVSTGVLHLEVERAGQLTPLDIKDPNAKMRAGDSRILKVTPRATLPAWWLGVVAFLMSLCVIGTHGLLSGTATMDFGGRKGAGTAVGIIDGFVYLGTAVQYLSLGYITSRDWGWWPFFLMPFAVIGFLLCTRIWNARPASRAPVQPSVGLDPAATTSGLPPRTGTSP